MEDLLVLVNEHDEVIGSGPKMEVHCKKQLHRAFSIFLYDFASDSLLLQQRAFGKYHSGGKWSNSCCSHPRWGEAYAHALARRLKDELSLSIPEEAACIHNLSGADDPLLCMAEDDSLPSSTAGSVPPFYYCGRFLYFADYGQLAEHEIDRVFFLPATQDAEIIPNPVEIASVCWRKRSEIRSHLAAQPDYYSAWFSRAFSLVDSGIERYRKELL